MYCERCRRITDDDRCPVCRSRRLREPRPEDECFLIEKPALWQNPISDFLHSEGIPFRCRSAMGAWLTARLGHGMDWYAFYVPYSVLPKAREMMEDYFTPVEEEKS